MANLTNCPTCGKSNPTGQEFCQYCQSPLNPFAGDDKPITPGQAPTKIITSDLESALPEWLRNARDSANQSYEEQPPAKTPQAAPSTLSSADLLAGLHSQSQDEEEDIPDWLANITGEAPKPKKPQAESSEVRWVELGDTKDFAQPEPEPDVPSWMSTPPAGETDELTDWMRAADASQQAQQSPQPFSFDSSESSSSSEETPDWLRSMVSSDGAAFTDAENPSEENFSSDTPDWLRGLDGGNAAPESSSPAAFSDTPDWLKAMDAENAALKPSAPPAFSDTPDWLKSMDAENAAPAAQPSSSETPDWLKSMDAEQSAVSDTPDWLKAMDAEKNDVFTPAAQPSSSDDAPDWLKSMDADQSAPAETPDWLKAMDAENAALAPAAQPASSDDAPDWLKSMDAENAAFTPASQPVVSDDAPDWLKSMNAEIAAVPLSDSNMPDWLRNLEDQGKTQSDDSAIFAGTGLGDAEFAAPSATEPDWLKSIESDKSVSDQDWLKDFQSVEEEKNTTGVQPSIEEANPVDIPSWLKAAAPQSSIFGEQPVAQDEPLSASASDIPDWLGTFKSAEPEPAFAAEKPVEAVPPQSGSDSDSLFTDMPDWLSIVDETSSPESIPAAITNTDAIAPGDLPSWVQAMRPVDAGVPAVVAMSANKTLETRGALAGLQGVLPAAPGYAPTSKPKAYSIRLQASEEQLSHAALLEQILSAETAPVSLDSFSTPGTSRALRWTLSILFFLILPAVLIMRTSFFALPDSVYVPLEVGGALRAVQAIPQDAPVLVIFDYQPSRAGEVESVAVPMFDQLILHHSRLTFASTTETGPVLAESLMSSGYLAGHENIQYVNLGYIPGGQMGIRAFAEKPAETTPYAFVQNTLRDFAPVDAWSQPPLAGVTSLPQFAALILVTDDADSARAWIEQTESVRGSMPFVVISSSQAAPMIQPYYASGQISGQVSGLYGGALFEQYNNQNPGTARAYWDAYSIGMLLAMVLILGGGLISLILGLRDRASAREAK